MEDSKRPFPLIKSIIGVFVVGACIFAMGPPPLLNLVKFRSGTEAAAAAAYGPDVEYVIRMTPGFAYMPGTQPVGFGDELKAFEEVAAEFRKLYPDTVIQFENVPNRQEYLVTQLIGGTAPDVVMTNVEDIWEDLSKGWYVPLDEHLESPNPFVPEGAPGSEQWWDIFRYQAITRGKVAPDGSMYCIPLDMVETAIYYNKTKFEELGLEIPQTWAEYIDMQKWVKENTQYAPTMLSQWNFVYWGTDLIFDQLYLDILPGIDVKQIPAQEEYFEGYLDWDELAFLYQKGFFTQEDPRWVEMFRLLKEWRSYSTDNISTADFRRMFLRQEGLTLWTACMFTAQLRLNPEIDFEWDVFYLPPMGPETSPYATNAEMCVIGGVAMQYIISNSAVKDTPRDPEADPQQDLIRRTRESERFERVLSWVQFITLPENAERVVNESTLFIPNIAGTDPHPSLKPFEEILEHRYTTTKWTATFDLRFREFFDRINTLYLLGGIESDDRFFDQLEDNLRLAAETSLRRKGVDLTPLEQRWEELAPLRATYEDLPPGARGGPDAGGPVAAATKESKESTQTGP